MATLEQLNVLNFPIALLLQQIEERLLVVFYIKEALSRVEVLSSETLEWYFDVDDSIVKSLLARKEPRIQSQNSNGSLVSVGSLYHSGASEAVA